MLKAVPIIFVLSVCVFLLTSFADKYMSSASSMNVDVVRICSLCLRRSSDIAPFLRCHLILDLLYLDQDQPTSLTARRGCGILCLKRTVVGFSLFFLV